MKDFDEVVKNIVWKSKLKNHIWDYVSEEEYAVIEESEIEYYCRCIFCSKKWVKDRWVKDSKDFLLDDLRVHLLTYHIIHILRENLVSDK